MDNLYRDFILEHYRTPHNKGHLDPHDLEFAAYDDKEWDDLVAGLHEYFTARGRPTPSIGRNPRHLLRRERRKRLIRTGDRCGQRRRRGMRRVH